MFGAAGLPWVDPSPNIRNLNEAILYPGIAMLEYSKNYSVGRGTDAPFEQIGADWIDGSQLAQYLNERHLAGVRCDPTEFTPESSNFSGKTIRGVRFTLTDPLVFDSSKLGLEIARALRTLYPGKIDWQAEQKPDRQQCGTQGACGR